MPFSYFSSVSTCALCPIPLCILRNSKISDMILFHPDIFSQPFQFYVLHQMIPCFPFATILPHSSLSNQIFLRESLVHIYNCLSKALGTRFDSEIRIFWIEKSINICGMITPVEFGAAPFNHHIVISALKCMAFHFKWDK